MNILIFSRIEKIVTMRYALIPFLFILTLSVSIAQSKAEEMKIRNDGEAPLVINFIDTTCACTRGEMKNEKIMPGQTGEQSPASLHSF